MFLANGDTTNRRESQRRRRRRIQGQNKTKKDGNTEKESEIEEKHDSIN